MHVCIALCGHMPKGAEKYAPSYAKSFEDLLSPNVPGAQFSAVTLVDGIERIEDIHAYDVFVFTGSPAGVYEDFPWIRHAEEVVQQAHEAGKVLIGICFGHQLIAQALGGKVVNSEKGWGAGVHEVAVVDREPWMAPALPEDRTSLNVLVSHQDQVIEPPAGAKTLISTEFCPHSMLRLGDTVLTMQGHPEMVKGIVEVILESRREKLGETVYTEAWKSLDKDLDHGLFGQWIGNFMRQAHGAKKAA